MQTNNVVLYERVDTGKIGDDPFYMQNKMCKEYAKTHNLNIPGWQAMIDYIENERCGGILALDRTRIGRNVFEVEEECRRLGNKGLSVITVI